ncbi:hypothetical protein [Bacillus sp. FJAT-45350]|uniref:hypothetical protein n=1 Tax=Bacillus sp. FJAT-45350 TaxID=2011014 RepID=UPI000BB84C3E|nr:hypothetical protein [Bacillus sp. FJAT-45350]
MATLFDTYLGFLPRHSVLWVSLGTALFVLVMQIIMQKLNKILELPYMKQKNQTERRKLMKEKQKAESSNS